MMFSREEIGLLRSETPGTNKCIHLNNAGSALMPRKVIKAIQQHIDLESNIGGYEAAATIKDQIADFYLHTAHFLNTKPRNIAFTSSATHAYALALSAIPWKENDVILTSSNDYASNFIAFFSLRKRFGISISIVENSPSGEIDLNDLQAKIVHLKPKVLAITHIPTNSGLVQPVEKIGQIAKSHDTIYLVDGCQSVGQRSIDVPQIHCDFFSATYRKFLRGPRGCGFLYASDRMLQLGLIPLFPDMRGADWTSATDYTSKPSAIRFEEWEKPYALLLGASAAVAYAQKVGIERIERRVTAVSEQLREGLQALSDFEVLDKGSIKAGLVTFCHKHIAPEQIQSHLDNHNINCSISDLSSAFLDYQEKGVTGAVRLSPHYYNTNEEIHKVIAVLDEIS